MPEVHIKGTVKAFSAKAPKQEKSAEPKPKQLSTRFCIDPQSLDVKALSQLCAAPKKAEQAIEDTAKAGGKIELPCSAEEQELKIIVGQRKTPSASSRGVVLNSIELDARGETHAARVSFTQPLTQSLGHFYLDNLDVDLELVFEPTQKRLPGAED